VDRTLGERDRTLRIGERAELDPHGLDPRDRRPCRFVAVAIARHCDRPAAGDQIR
jgi:hypothetical protein